MSGFDEKWLLSKHEALTIAHKELQNHILAFEWEQMRLKAEVERLRKDAKRLNWLESHPSYQVRKHKKRWSCVEFTNYEYETFPTMREAIDSAMKESTCQPTLTECPRCHNDTTKCDGVFKGFANAARKEEQ
jgi:hypothetical protein